MQWLIDLILETIRKDGLAVNRGDPANLNFDTGDFTYDNAWHDLDLSSIIPINATVVYIDTVLRATIINARFFVRTKGNVNDKNLSRLRTQVAGIPIDADFITFPNDDRILEYKASTVNINLLQLTVKGWDF